MNFCRMCGAPDADDTFRGEPFHSNCADRMAVEAIHYESFTRRYLGLDSGVHPTADRHDTEPEMGPPDEDWEGVFIPYSRVGT